MAKRTPRNVTKQRTRPAKYHTPLLLTLFLLLPCYGGYYSFIILFCGAVFTLAELYEIHRAGAFLLPTGAEARSLYLLSACHLFSIPFAVSRGMAFVGFLRTLVWVLFFLCASAYSQEERERIFDTLAWEGAVLSAVAVVLFAGNRILGAADLNGRIDGPFQYANAWALFQLVCLIALLVREKRSKAHWIAGAALLCGIGLSASRGVILLGAAFAAVGAVHLIQAGRLRLLGQSALAVCGIGIMAGFLSGGLLWERLLAVPRSSSFNGRLLYVWDGLRMLARHPLGLGRGGYFYAQALEQTGVYTSRFVHNDFLQFALDAGIAAGIASLCLVVFSLFRPGIPKRERLMVLAIGLHACADIDFQFPVIMCLLLLCAAGGRERRIPLARRSGNRGARVLNALAVVLTLCFLWFSMVYGLDFSGHSAWRLFPADLELAEKGLQRFPSPEAARPLAEDILRSTDLSMLAWDCEYQAAARREDFPKMAEAKYHYLRLNRYRGEVYEQFASLLEDAAAREPENVRLWREWAQGAEEQLKEVMERTSPLAYRVADKPDFAFAEALNVRLRALARAETADKSEP